MSEIILNIEEKEWQLNYNDFEGVLVTTNKQTIKIGIEAGQSCCENYGFFSTNDDIQYFIGAEVFGIKLTDTGLNTQILKDKLEDIDRTSIQFVDIETSKGPLQYAVYNDHNGFYGHDIRIISDQLNFDGKL